MSHNLYPDLNLGNLHVEEEFPSPPSPLPPESEDMKELQSNLPVYDHKLYTIQLSAPKPRAVKSHYEDDDKPAQYGDEYHGKMERSEVKLVLRNTDGNYLVRESVTRPGQYSLSFVFRGEIKHYIIDYRNGKHCIGHKEFDSVYSLTMDGLISLHVQLEAGDYLTKCITMRRQQPPAAQQHVTSKHVTIQEEEEEACDTPGYLDVENVYVTHEETVEDGVKLRYPGNARNKGNRQTVKVTSFYEAPSQDFAKEHKFQIHTYFGFPFCQFCNNYMWGLTQQGYECSDCGYDVHHQCKEYVPSSCKPNKKRVSKVFGVDLTSLVLLKHCATDNIPTFLHACITLIEGRGMKTEGLYRVNGSFDDVTNYKNHIDNNGNANILQKADTFVLCSLLKQFLRELPMPLVTFDAYQPFIEANDIAEHDDRIGKTKDAIKLLPDSHFHSLKAVIEHITRLSGLSDSNHMTAENLSIVFGPTIFRSPALSADSMIRDMALQKQAVKFMIEHCWRLFR